MDHMAIGLLAGLQTKWSGADHVGYRDKGARILNSALVPTDSPTARPNKHPLNLFSV
jgi:hypothetical protein